MIIIGLYIPPLQETAKTRIILQEISKILNRYQNPTTYIYGDFNISLKKFNKHF